MIKNNVISQYLNDSNNLVFPKNIKITFLPLRREVHMKTDIKL